MTIDGELLAVIDVEPSWAEDGRTLFLWYRLADGREALATFTLGAPIGQAVTAPFIVEGVLNRLERGGVVGPPSRPTRSTQRR